MTLRPGRISVLLGLTADHTSSSRRGQVSGYASQLVVSAITAVGCARTVSCDTFIGSGAQNPLSRSPGCEDTSRCGLPTKEVPIKVDALRRPTISARSQAGG